MSVYWTNFFGVVFKQKCNQLPLCFCTLHYWNSKKKNETIKDINYFSNYIFEILCKIFYSEYLERYTRVKGSLLIPPIISNDKFNYPPPPPHAEVNSSLIGWNSLAHELYDYAAYYFAHPSFSIPTKLNSERKYHEVLVKKTSKRKNYLKPLDKKIESFWKFLYSVGDNQILRIIERAKAVLQDLAIYNSKLFFQIIKYRLKNEK